MDKVYEFWYNPCTFESLNGSISLHRTHKGATLAMKEHKEKKLKEFEELFGDDECMSFEDYCSDKKWGVLEREVLD